MARSWIYELLRPLPREGDAPSSRVPAAAPASRRDPGGHRRADHQAAPQLTRQGLDAGSHTIAWHLAEQHQLTVSEATIWRTLQRAGLITPEPKKKPKAAYIRFAAEQPNQMWQTDFTHYRLTRPDGTPGADVEILTFLDDHSRYALSDHLPPAGHRASRGRGVPASRR